MGQLTTKLRILFTAAGFLTALWFFPLVAAGTHVIAAAPPSSALFPSCWGGLGNESLYYTQGLMLRQIILYQNPNKDQPIKDPRMVLEYPTQALQVVTVAICGGPNMIRRDMNQQEFKENGVAMTRLTIPLWDIPAGFTWKGNSPWSVWPGWESTLYIRGGIPGRYALKWHLESAQGNEPVHSAPIVVLPAPIPPTGRASIAGHGVGVWVYSLSSYGNFPDIQDGLAQTLAACGVRRAYVSVSALPSARALKARGIEVLLTNNWPYSVFAPSEPQELHQAVSAKMQKIPGNAWCPTAVAQRAPAWEQAVRPAVTDAIKRTQADGFILDYEGTAVPGYGASQICFCDRCRQAFLARLGPEGTSLRWPGDVLPNGKWQPRWVDWRSEQGAMYVKNVADLAREGNSKAQTYTWSCGYYKPYPQHAIYSRDCSDITKFAKYLTGVTVGVYVYPNDPVEALRGHPQFGTSPTDWGGGIPDMNAIMKWTIEAVRPSPVIPCVSGGHMAEGRATPLASVSLLRQQIQQDLNNGAVGVDFWGTGPMEDGRYVALLADLAKANSK